mgnify:CR=1 FL=1
MTDLDQLLDQASRDVKASVRSTAQLDPRVVRTRATRRRVVTVLALALLAVTFVGLGSLISARSGDIAEQDRLITSDEILADGLVTEAEYRAGAQAVVECLSEAGFAATVSFSDRTRHASFSIDHTDAASSPAGEAATQCREVHLSHNVGLGWSDALGQLDLKELARQETEVFSCVETVTGQNFGEIGHDQHGFLTESGQASKDAAFEYQDHEPWMRCQNDLGFLEESKNQTRSVFECVENRTGKDFGEVEFNEFGAPTEESEAALRAAVHFDNDAVWLGCEEDLGVIFGSVGGSDD